MFPQHILITSLLLQTLRCLASGGDEEPSVRIVGLSLENGPVLVKIRIGGNIEGKVYRGCSGRVWEGWSEAGAGRAKDNTENDGDERT